MAERRHPGGPLVDAGRPPGRVAPRTSLSSLPNLLAVARIAATPVVFLLTVVDWPAAGMSAALIFAAAAVTDFLDGRIARARRAVSPLGVFLDLAADKVLVAGALVALVQVGLLPGWVAAAILIREFVVQAVRQLAAAEDVVIAARGLGKAKTLLTLVGIWVLLLARDASSGGPLAAVGIGPVLAVAGAWLMVLAAAVTVVSGVLYLAAAWPMLAGDEPEAR
ncbi:MAG TPA: CDP-diacylglycerol--glycerol-3-phosphate 3-phosphatidyltransferase [Candidatus Limnocylindria bacterium]|nr:CDP-diacylglycerol--glycerol-3-phosphate 3-phosphatidyltransferase [Candidatus Limnocylindria bacterium]